MKNVVSTLKSKISTLSNQLADRSLFYKEKESKAFCHLNVSLLQMKPRPKKLNLTEKEKYSRNVQPFFATIFVSIRLHVSQK